MSAHILCVDDNPRNLRIMRELLGDEYELEYAETGEEALLRAKDRIPDLVLLDVMLPGLDGYEVCRRLRADESTATVPVVLVTARARDDERRRGFEAGAVDYVIKPFDPDVVLDIVEKHVGASPEVLA